MGKLRSAVFNMYIQDIPVFLQMVGFCFQLSELDIFCVYNGEKVAIGNICSLMFNACFYHVFIQV